MNGVTTGLSQKLTEEASQQEKKDNFKMLALLKIGLFEILFVSIALILFFGIMNYFNLLPISILWPNQFGWLPHRQQLSNVTIEQPDSPTGGSNNRVVLPSPTPFLTQTAKQTLNNYLPTILVPSLLPRFSDISFIQNEGLRESFTVSFDTKAGTISAFIIFYPDGKNVSQIYASFLKPATETPSLSIASTTTSDVFSINPKGKWACKALESPTVYCENFWEENGLKRGLGVQGVFTKKSGDLSINPSVIEVFFCERTKASPLYPWKSCTAEFSKTGVQ